MGKTFSIVMDQTRESCLGNTDPKFKAPPALYTENCVAREIINATTWNNLVMKSTSVFTARVARYSPIKKEGKQLKFISTNSFLMIRCKNFPHHPFRKVHIPVSYTHLDVYKRQVFYKIHGPLIQRATLFTYKMLARCIWHVNSDALRIWKLTTGNNFSGRAKDTISQYYLNFYICERKTVWRIPTKVGLPTPYR